MLEDRYSLFRKKYIVLRDLYGLDNKIVSQFGNLIYNNHLGRGNVAFWADGRRTPSVDGIFSLAALFAVSPFWLGKKKDTDALDLSNAYSLLQVEGLEEVMVENYSSLIKEFICDDYLEENFRAEYSKEARANILALFQILIGERKLYPTSKKADHKVRVQEAQNGIKTILETKRPIKIITETK